MVCKYRSLIFENRISAKIISAIELQKLNLSPVLLILLALRKITLPFCCQLYHLRNNVKYLLFSVSETGQLAPCMRVLGIHIIMSICT